MLAGQLGDCFRPGEHLDGQVSPLLRRQLLGRTRNMNSCRSWPVKRSRSGSGITLRDRDGQSSLTIHICFLRETVFVGTNHPNMEETGSLEHPIPSGKCYLDLNRAVRVEGVEPTNNGPERALRHAVIWRRISGGTDSADGSRLVERMLTVVATCRQQKRNVLLRRQVR